MGGGFHFVASGGHKWKMVLLYTERYFCHLSPLKRLQPRST